VLQLVLTPDGAVPWSHERLSSPATAMPPEAGGGSASGRGAKIAVARVSKARRSRAGNARQTRCSGRSADALADATGSIGLAMSGACGKPPLSIATERSGMQALMPQSDHSIARTAASCAASTNQRSPDQARGI
jgi:hypothetical protein